MSLRLNTKRSLISRKLSGSFVAVMALMLQPLLPLNIPAAFAATATLYGPESATVTEASPFDTGLVTTTDHTNRVVSFEYDHAALDNGDSFTYEVFVHGMPVATDTIDGANGDTPGFQSLTAYSSTSTAGNIQLKVTASTDVASDKVELRNITVTGDPVAPADITDLRLSTHAGTDYDGLVVDFYFENFTDATGATVEITRDDGSTVTNTLSGSLVSSHVNTGNRNPLTSPFPIVEKSYTAAGDSAWSMNPVSPTWDSTTTPTSVTVTIQTPNGPVTETVDAISETGGTTYASLLPPTPVLTEPYANGFESDASDWSGSVDRVASGTDGIDAAAGNYYAKIVGAAHTYMNNFGSNVFPDDGYTTEVDVYLDTSKADGVTEKGFDWNSALSNQAGNNLEESFFQVRTSPDTANQWRVRPHIVVSGMGYPNDKGPWTNISETGWYTFQHHFREGTDGLLYIDMTVLDAEENVISTYTVGGYTEYVVDTVAGGSDYGWFSKNELSSIAADNACLYLGAPVANGCGFTTDAQGPVIGFESFEDPTSGTTRIVVTLEDENGINTHKGATHFRYMVGKNLIGAAEGSSGTYALTPIGGNRYEAVVDTHDFVPRGSEGDYRVYIRAQDNLGNVSSRYEAKSNNVTIDNRGPVISDVRVDRLVRGVAEIRVDIHDDSGISLAGRDTHVRFTRGQNLKNGAAIQSANAVFTYDAVNDDYVARIDTTDFADNGSGAYWIYIRAEDSLGNAVGNDDVRGIVVDNAKPVASIQSPADGAILEGTVPVTITANDGEKLAAYSYRIKNTATGGETVVNKVVNSETGVDGETVFEWNTKNFANGEYYVYVSARDEAGNRDEQRFYVTVANEDPELEVTSPTLNQAVPGDEDITVTGVVADNTAINRVVMFVDDSQNGTRQVERNFSSTQGGAFSFTIPAGTLPEGAHRLVVNAYDEANNSSVVRVDFVVANTEGETGSGDTDGETGSGDQGGENINDGTGGESIDEQPEEQTAQIFTTPAGLLGNQPIFGGQGTPATENEEANTDDDNGDVLGEQDQEEGTPLEDTGEVLGLMDKNFFGLAWYWWLAIVAAIVGGWLAIAAMIRHSREEEV